MKSALLIIGGLLAAVVAYFVLGYTLVALNIAALPLFKLESKVNTAQGIIGKTYNADNALQQYHYFKQTYEAIQADQNKIDQAKTAQADFEKAAGPRDKWTFEDKTEDSRLRAVVQGLQSHYEDLVAEYNAAAKSADRAVFKDNLPTFINL